MKLKKPHSIALPPRILVLRTDAPDPLSGLDDLVGKLIPTHGAPQALVISLRRMARVETSGLRVLERAIGRLRAHGITVLLTEASALVRDFLEKCRLLEALGGNAYYDDFAAAVAHCHALNGGAGDRRMLVVDAYAESMLSASCGYLQAPEQSP